MREEPPSEPAPRHAPWKALLNTLLVTAMSAVTVLGAVLLSLQGQSPADQPGVRQLESTPAEPIPTAAIVTPPPVTLPPATPAGDTGESAAEASPSPVDKPQDAVPSPSPKTAATPIPVGPTVSAPSATPLPCAGGVPLDWRLYIVQPGDTLFSLARRHGTTTYWVAYYNCLNSYQVSAGQRLYLPPVPTPPSSTDATATASPAPTITPVGESAPTPVTSPTRVPIPTDTPAPDPPTTATPTTRPTTAAPGTASVTLTSSATTTISPTAAATSTPNSEPSATPAASLTPGASPTPTARLVATDSPSPTPTP